MTRILCLWLPNWPIQRAVRCRPALKGRSVALVMNGPRGSEVAACCSTAVAQGVRPGMPLVEAQALVRGLGVATYDPAADRRALAKCAEACERFSPRVALEDGAEPESVLLDISNLEHLWGNEGKLVGRVEEFFTQRGYLVRLAAAETVGAAWAKAHFEGGGRKEEGGREDRRANFRMLQSLVPSPQSPRNCPFNRYASLRTQRWSCASWASKPWGSWWLCHARSSRRGLATSCCGDWIN